MFDNVYNQLLSSRFSGKHLIKFSFHMHTDKLKFYELFFHYTILEKKQVRNILVIVINIVGIPEAFFFNRVVRSIIEIGW